MTTEFQKIQMSAMSINSKGEFYRVYKTQAEYVDVEAFTANEAMEKSQVKTPYRIKFMRPKSGSFLSSSDLLLINNAAQDVTNDVKAEVAKGFEASIPPKIEPNPAT